MFWSDKVEVDNIRSWHFIFIVFFLSFPIGSTRYTSSVFGNSRNAGWNMGFPQVFWFHFNFEWKNCQVVSTRSFQWPSQVSQRFSNRAARSLWKRTKLGWGCGNLSLPGRCRLNSSGSSPGPNSSAFKTLYPRRVACLKNEQQEHVRVLFDHSQPYPSPGVSIVTLSRSPKLPQVTLTLLPQPSPPPLGCMYIYI